MATFDSIAEKYRQLSLVQASAGEQLIELLAIPPHADILDVGCGTGNLTALLAGKTDGRITGIDQSAAMIAEASRTVPAGRAEFLVQEAEAIDFDNAFDIIYCNSAFQWFQDPSGFLGRAFRALRPGGRIGMQAPATQAYCPTFLKALDRCCRNPAIGETFSGFRSPWFFLETAEAYARRFAESGFRVRCSSIDEVHSHKTPQEGFSIFCSGAKAAYLDPGRYREAWPEGYGEALLDALREAFMSMADADGRVDLVFRRIFVVAEREA